MTVLLVLLSFGAPRAAAEMWAPMHGCATKPDRTLSCWGFGGYGQFGEGVPTMFAPVPGMQMTDMYLAAPRAVSGVGPIRSIGLGVASSCVVTDARTVKCWGYGPVGGASYSTTPVEIGGLGVVDSVSVGLGSACAVHDGGSVSCWGEGEAGVLGNGDGTRTAPSSSATPIVVPGISDATGVAVGLGHACAVRAGGSVWCWGTNPSGQLGSGGADDSPSHNESLFKYAPAAVTGVGGAIAVAVGYENSCAVLASGAVRCWGDNDGGQLGNGTTVDSPSPVAVQGLADARSVLVGPLFACAVRTSGAMRCWGRGGEGQLGDGRLEGSSVPVDVIGVDGAVSAYAGSESVCATLAGSRVKCWGTGVYGQLGSGHLGIALAPTPVTGLSGVSALANGSDFACAIASGTTKCWGSNDETKLYVDEVVPQVFAPSTVSYAGDLTALASGSDDTCGIFDGGRVRCWGRHGGGVVSGINAATDLSVGRLHQCAVDDGAVKCWGSNGYGQLGTDSGATPSSAVPIVAIASGARSVAAGDSGTCAVLVDGGVRCWGSNSNGELGVDNSVTPSSSSPVDNGIADAVQVAAGDRHFCARLAGGGAKCWGANGKGQLGNGSYDNGATTAPVTVSGLTTATDLDAGRNTTCAVLADTTARCWGDGGSGQVGSGTAPYSSEPQYTVPTVVAGLSGAQSISVGGGTNCALLGDGTVQCWGGGERGELGDGFMPAGHGPQPVPAYVIGFGDGAEPEPESEQPQPGPVAPSEPGPAATTAPAPAVAPLPLPGMTPTPALTLERKRAAHVRLVGRRLVFTNFRVTVKKGGRNAKRCAKRSRIGLTVKVRLKGTKRPVVKRLKIRKVGKSCLVVKATVTLPKRASKLKSVKLTVSGKGIKSRSAVARRR